MNRYMTLALALLTAGCAPAVATKTTQVEVSKPPEPVPEPVRAPPAEPMVEVGAEGLGPAEIDVSRVVVADYPPAFVQADAPATLPPGVGPGLEHTPGRLMKGGALGFGQVEVPGQKLVRMQIGTVRMHGVAAARAFLYCESDIARWRSAGGKPRPPKPRRPLSSVSKPKVPMMGSAFNPRMRHPGITPARWEVLSRDAGGEVVLTITDAWFDHRTCRASAQRVTHIRPQPLLDGLAYVFKGACADCREREPLTLVMPTFVGSSRPGRHVSGGAFVVARFPLGRHRNSRLAGLVDRWPMRNWQRSLHGVSSPVSAFPKTLLSAELTWSSQTRRHTLRLFGARTST